MTIYRTTAILMSLLPLALPSATIATDLEVLCVDRDPKYPKYDPDYVVNHVFTDDFTPYRLDVATGLEGGQTPETQRWPDPGDEVTFTVHVHNKGDVAVNSFICEWEIDGSPAQTDSFAGSLAPQEIVSFDLPWSWQTDAHTITVSLDVAGDEHLSDNTLSITSNALALYTFVDRGYAADFKANTPAWGMTDSITEWCQRHMTHLNQMFADAGSPIRVRWGMLTYLEDGAPLPPAFDPVDYDGSFPARFDVGDNDYRFQSYYYYDDEDIDYGFLHEICHQLGLIDLYQIDLDGATNDINSESYEAIPGLMNGVSHWISPHSAMAMAWWHGLRRGYFGQYLYSTPQTNQLRFLAMDGEPLADADVMVFQRIEKS